MSFLSFTGPPVLSLGSPFPGLVHGCFLFFESERAEECFWTADWSECILTALGVTRHSFRSRLLVKIRTFQMVCCVLLFIIASCFSLYAFNVSFPFIVKCFVIFVKGAVFFVVFFYLNTFICAFCFGHSCTNNQFALKQISWVNIFITQR